MRHKIFCWIRTLLLLIFIGLMVCLLAGCGGGGGGGPDFGDNGGGGGPFTGNISGEWEISATPDLDTMTGTGNCNRPEPYTYRLTFSRNGNQLMIEDMELQESWTGTMDGNRCTYSVRMNTDGLEIIIDGTYQFTSDTAFTASATVQGDDGNTMCAWEENQQGRRINGGIAPTCVAVDQGRWDFEWIRADNNERLLFSNGQLTQNGCIVTFTVGRDEFAGELVGNRWSGNAAVWSEADQRVYDFTFSGTLNGDPAAEYTGTWTYAEDNTLNGEMRGSRD